METKFTPGPWEIKSDGKNQGGKFFFENFNIQYSDGELRSEIATLFDSKLCEEHGDVKANARLISYAPDLYKTLKTILEVWDEHKIIGPTVYHDAWNIIFKIEG